VQSKEAGLASWNPVDEDEGGGGSAVLVHEVVGKHDISRRSLGELWKNKTKTSGGIRGATRSMRRTLCQVFWRNVVFKPVGFLHDQLLLVDLDDERSIPFVPSEPELANRVFKFLGDVYGVGLGYVRKWKWQHLAGQELGEDKP
jgi:hypothetical protein